MTGKAEAADCAVGPDYVSYLRGENRLIASAIRVTGKIAQSLKVRLCELGDFASRTGFFDFPKGNWASALETALVTLADQPSGDGYLAYCSVEG